MQTAIDKARAELRALEQNEAALNKTIEYLNKHYAGRTFVSHGNRGGKYVYMVSYGTFTRHDPFDKWAVKVDRVGVQFKNRSQPVSFSSVVNTLETGTDQTSIVMTKMVEVPREHLDRLIRDVQAMSSFLGGRLSAETGYNIDVHEEPAPDTPAGVTIDIPHITLDSQERDIVRDSPFLCGDRLYLSPASSAYAHRRIVNGRYELQRGSHMFNDGDSRYVVRREAVYDAFEKRLIGAMAAMNRKEA